MEFEVHGRIKGNLFNDKSISQDPIKLEGNNPNPYAYTFDSNSKVDPFGLMKERKLWELTDKRSN